MPIEVGTPIPPFEVAAVSAEKMKTMSALMHDSNPIHFDVQSVRALGMGDRTINQGPSNMAYVINMLAIWAGSYGRVRDFRLRFIGNVFADDALRASGTVTALRREGGHRLADCEVRLDRADGAKVLLGSATVIVDDAMEAAA